MKCNQCGTEFEGNFCPECGAETGMETPPPIQQQTNQNNYQQPMSSMPDKAQKKKKPFYLRWWFILIAVFAVLSVFFSIKGGNNHSKNNGKYEIPNVFGVAYTDAVDVLEADGFEVKTVETSVKEISDKLSHPLETVAKGSVFKIDDYIYDGIGDLTLNYDTVYGAKMTSNDKSIIIYYAKEAYSRNSDTAVNTDSKDNVNNTDTSVSSETPAKESSENESNSTDIHPDFKTAMDSYEKFFDEYVAIMKKYKSNPGDTSILADYTKYMGKYAQMMSDFEKWESEDMNDAELAYYLEVQGRITKKLLEVSQ